MAMNVDDPTTWPDDLDGEALLAALDGESDAAAETVEDGTDGEAPVVQVQEPETVAGPGAGSGGDKLVPVSALAELRAELRAQKEHAAELAQQVERLSGAGTAAAETAGEGSDEPAIDPLDEQIRRAVEAGDDDLAAAFREQKAQAERIARLEQTLEAQAQQAAQSQQAAVVAAFEASPLLKAWAADTEHPLWHQTGVQLHRALLADPNGEYARMSPAEQFARLPGLVEAQLGVQAPHRAALAVAAGQAGQHARGRVAAKAEPTDPVPLSMSHIPGGYGQDPAPRVGADLEQMEPGERRAYLLSLADDPDAVLEFLDGLPLGATNSRSRRNK